MTTPRQLFDNIIGFLSTRGSQGSPEGATGAPAPAAEPEPMSRSRTRRREHVPGELKEPSRKSQRRS